MATTTRWRAHPGEGGSRVESVMGHVLVVVSAALVAVCVLTWDSLDPEAIRAHVVAALLVGIAVAAHTPWEFKAATFPVVGLLAVTRRSVAGLVGRRRDRAPS